VTETENDCTRERSAAGLCVLASADRELPLALAFDLPPESACAVSVRACRAVGEPNHARHLD